jgi:AcrR family transcriptional regulator
MVTTELVEATKKIPGKRTRQMARADRRKQLLHLARQLIAANGLAGLTMNALSEAAGVAKTVVYSHFANRHEVAIALLDEHFSALIAFVIKQTADAKTLEEYISLFVDSAFAFEGTSDTPVRKITNGFSAGDEVNKAYQAHEDKLWKQWQRLLMLQGIPKDMARIASYPLSSMMNSAVFYFAIQTDKDQARSVLKTLLVSSIKALAPTGGGSFKGLHDFNPNDPNLPPAMSEAAPRPAFKREIKK